MRSVSGSRNYCLLYFKVLAVTGLVHRDFRVDKVAPKDKYFQSYFCGMSSQEKNVTVKAWLFVLISLQPK